MTSWQVLARLAPESAELSSRKDDPQRKRRDRTATAKLMQEVLNDDPEMKQFLLDLLQEEHES